jgi:hypothetical protein
MGQTQTSQSLVIQPEKESETVSPQAEVFWQAFLGLPPEDQRALTDRIINRNTLTLEKKQSA